MPLQPISLNYANWFVSLLTTDWPRGEYKTERLYYAQFTTVITTLVSVTGSLERTARLFLSIVNQAYVLNQTEDWIESELLFEAQAATLGDRPCWLQAWLAKTQGSDAALDLYNLRVNRTRVLILNA